MKRLKIKKFEWLTEWERKKKEKVNYYYIPWINSLALTKKA